MGIRVTTSKEYFQNYIDIFIQRMPKYAIEYPSGWRMRKGPLTDFTIQKHLDRKQTVGTLGRWYPEYAVLDMDSVSEETVDRIRETLNLNEDNSMLLSSESPDSYHLLFKPVYNDNPPTLRLLKDVFDPFCKMRGIEIYPQKKRVIRAPFDAHHRRMDIEYSHIDNWQQQLYWFEKLDAFDLSGVEYHQPELSLWLPKQPLPGVSTYTEGQELFQYGLQRPSSRHEAQFKVLYYLFQKNIPQSEAEQIVWHWINKLHNGFSETILINPSEVRAHINRQATKIYSDYEHARVYPNSTHNRHHGYITEPDIQEIVRICQGSIPRIKFLFNLIKYSYPRRHRIVLRLHTNKFIAWSGHRTYQKYLTELEVKGIASRGSGYLAGAFSKPLKVNWNYKDASDAVLLGGRSIDTLNSTVRQIYQARDFRDMLTGAGAYRTTAIEAVKRIYEEN